MKASLIRQNERHLMVSENYTNDRNSNIYIYISIDSIITTRNLFSI